MKNQEFDRSVCFQFYESYLEQGQLVKDQLGAEMCADYFIALVRYGLYQEEPEDQMVKMLISGLKNTIDAGQAKRARAFNKENTEQTEAIVKYKQEHPDATQREIASACNCSLGKVNKALNSNNNSNNNINSNSNSNSNTNNNSVNVNVNTQEKESEKREKESIKRKIEDLTNEEGNDICKRLKNHESYISLSNMYNLEPGSITKNFPKQWKNILSNRSYWAEQRFEMERRKNEPQIDYNKIYSRADKANREKRKQEKEHQDMISEIMDDLLVV